MDEKKVLLFIKKLSNDTANEKISWQRLNDYQNLAQGTPTSISYLFWECEFRHIDYHNSYFAIIGRGAIFILYEDNESGRDGTHSVGYKLYLQDDIKNVISNLPCPSSAIYQLLNAVQVCIAKTEAEAESFIDDYLSHE